MNNFHPLENFQEGGPLMYAIFCLGVVTVGLIFERAVTLFSKVKVAPEKFRENLLQVISRGDFIRAEGIARNEGKGTALGRIVEVGCSIRASGGGDAEIQARMDEKLSSEISSIDRRTGFLAMCGNVSTLVGLLGTITGMIHSFAAVASANPSDRATMLSKGISEAMNCTAFGLAVAIPALVAYAILQNKTDRIVTFLTEGTSEIFHDLVYLSEAHESATPSSRISNDVRGTGISAGFSQSPQLPV